jgi:DNA-binding transcriptional LysR family regulator
MNPRDIRSLDVGMLRTFDALMRERSVSRAAARLFLSQPAVSASLNRLREVFDDPLFTRTGHGVTPTPRAHALAPQIGKVLADLARLLEGDPATRHTPAGCSGWQDPTLPAPAYCPN